MEVYCPPPRLPPTWRGYEQLYPFLKRYASLVAGTANMQWHTKPFRGKARCDVQCAVTGH